MRESLSQPTEPIVEPLTRREREILAQLAQGLSAAEIAQKLTLAVSSASTAAWPDGALISEPFEAGRAMSLDQAIDYALSANAD